VLSSWTALSPSLSNSIIREETSRDPGHGAASFQCKGYHLGQRCHLPSPTPSIRKKSLVTRDTSQLPSSVSLQLRLNSDLPLLVNQQLKTTPGWRTSGTRTDGNSANGLPCAGPDLAPLEEDCAYGLSWWCCIAMVAGQLNNKKMKRKPTMEKGRKNKKRHIENSPPKSSVVCGSSSSCTWHHG
jgi:hypothetical protein